MLRRGLLRAHEAAAFCSIRGSGSTSTAVAGSGTPLKGFAPTASTPQGANVMGTIKNMSSETGLSRDLAKRTQQAAASKAQDKQGFAEAIKSGLGPLAALALSLPLLAGGAALADSPERWQLLFQDPAAPIAKAIHDLHHDIMFILWTAFGIVTYMLFRTIHAFSWHKRLFPDKLTRNTSLEVIWTLIPLVLLAFISLPSLALLYAIDDAVRYPKVTVKVIGHQWYWSYEYSDYANGDKTIQFDSYMVPEDDLEPGQLRLLEVDNRMVVPANVLIRVLVSAADVIHSWAVPSFGIKCDAIPGRLNVTAFQALREGVFYGQCSELCGVMHGFMPIVVEAVPMSDYISWVREKLAEA